MIRSVNSRRSDLWCEDGRRGAGVACRRLDVCFGHPVLTPVCPEGKRKLLPDAPVGSSIPCGIGLEPFLAPAPILKGPGQCFLGAEQDDVVGRAQGG